MRLFLIIFLFLLAGCSDNSAKMAEEFAIECIKGGGNVSATLNISPFYNSMSVSCDKMTMSTRKLTMDDVFQKKGRVVVSGNLQCYE